MILGSQLDGFRKVLDGGIQVARFVATMVGPTAVEIRIGAARIDPNRIIKRGNRIIVVTAAQQRLSLLDRCRGITPPAADDRAQHRSQHEWQSRT